MKGKLGKITVWRYLGVQCLLFNGLGWVGGIVYNR